MTDWIEISVPSLRGKESEYLEECIKTNYVSSIGPFIKDFEELTADNIGLTKNKTAATSSGTTALQLGLLALGVAPKELVIIPSYTFIATANAVSHIGANPWIIDSEMDYLTMDSAKLETELQKNTYTEKGKTYHKETKQKIACIVPVYIFGCPPNIDEIKSVANKYSIPIILDSACGIGAKYKNHKIGQTNLPGIISFNGNKTITSGAGGIFYSNEKSFVDKVRHLSTTAKSSSKYDHDEIGYNYRMSNIQAALGLAQLEQVDRILNEKRMLHENYKNSLNNFNQFKLISNPPWGKSSYWLNAILLNKDIPQKIETLIQKLRDFHIRANYFWKPLHLQKPYKDSLKSNLSELDDIQERILILPSSPSLKIEEQERVIDVIQHFFR